MVPNNLIPFDLPGFEIDRVDAAPELVVVGLDRLLHHAEVLTITGASFRARSRSAILTGSASVSAEHTGNVMELVEKA